MKVAFEFWRHRLVCERCVVEIDVPDALAKDPYLPGNVAGATMRAKADEMPWQIEAEETHKSGYRLASDVEAA